MPPVTRADNKTTETRVDSNGDGKTDQIVTESFDSIGTETVDTKNLNANGAVVNETLTTTSADRAIIDTQVDSNGDGTWDQKAIAADTNNDGVTDTSVSNQSNSALSDYEWWSINNQIQESQNYSMQLMRQQQIDHEISMAAWQIENEIFWARQQWETEMATYYYNRSTANLMNWSFETAPYWQPSGYYYGKEAFYSVVTPILDTAGTVANQTFRILDSANQAVTAPQLEALDTNQDGTLSGTELDGLHAWVDTNEDGLGQTIELTTLAAALANAGLLSVRASDYAYYTAGNAGFKTLAQESALAPVNFLAPAVMPTAPDSNYRNLRDLDNTYWINSYQYIPFGASQIKINNYNRSYLIGTDGNDAFDASYYAAYNGIYFNTNLLVNFLAGDGDDVMGGSIRNDRLWGGSGNDTLLGYEGDDKLYGEEGNDQLLGGTGADLLDGGVGDDVLFGQDGNDTGFGIMPRWATATKPLPT